MQLLYITKVKTDTAVRSISLSVLVLRNQLRFLRGVTLVDHLFNCWDTLRGNQQPRFLALS